ncbi:AAA family ATPase [Mangrovibacterium marinum]|uniref:Putative ATP-binding protein involved in virulence n=1 Tax=Mangrovibacterium marinum TaxID=1639118 RepID=A0A2T5BYF9_9BACT|nr:AAA family ATPase [Mangrovibacterium marinum]PTN07257.1 putative ATP-binding protein involved in virulence [Mangrovibacterium marinum]
MKIRKLAFENFRGKEELTLSLGARLSLFIGENGAGKTTVLDGLAIGLGAALTHLPEVSGITFSKTDLRQRHNQLAPYVRVRIDAFEGISWDRTLKRDKSKATAAQVPAGVGLKQLTQYLDSKVINPYNDQQDFVLPVFAYYGVSRALLEVPLRRRGFPKAHFRFEALNNSLNAVSRFKSAFIWFYNKENEEQRKQKELRSFDFTLPELNAVRHAITTMFPGVTEPHIMLNPLRFAVRLNGELLDINQLSDGYKTLLSLVIDLASRMALANPTLENPLSSPAVVLIDEVDLHLHPEWQRRVIGDLLRVFSNTQFILTTHSPYIVESINNHLQKSHIEGMAYENPLIDEIIPVSPTDVVAYFMAEDKLEAIMDPEVQLIDDKLIYPFNTLSEVYDLMRDVQWENKTND